MKYHCEAEGAALEYLRVNISKGDMVVQRLSLPHHNAAALTCEKLQNSKVNNKIQLHIHLVLVLIGRDNLV